MGGYMRDLLLRQWQAPGDLIVLTVALRDLHLSYPDQFRTQVISCYPEVFYKNPYQSKLSYDEPWLNLWYKKWREIGINTGAHFSDAFIQELNEQLQLNIQKTSIWPELYLDDDEKDPKVLQRFGIEQPYWVINAGIKVDYPIKQYPPFYWQKAINYLNQEQNKFGMPLVQAGHSHDMHPQLEGVTNLVGKTNNIRDYFTLMYHAEGSMGHVSLHMHVAAAFRKPCVVVAGGREGLRWEVYPGHQFLHVTGLLPCAGLAGCWISVPRDCLDLRHGIPQCYRMIRPEDVCGAVLKYYCK